MKRIDEYVNNIYKGFDDTDPETQILIEETKSHLYDEVEDLKNQGFSEDESIKKAIFNFGKEKSVIKELKGILKKQDKFSKVLLRISLILYCIGIILKSICLGYDISGVNEKKWSDYENDKNSSEYVFNIIGEKLNDKDSIDENLKNEIDEILDEFNDRRNNGIYHIYLVKNNEYLYEYNKEISEEQIEANGNGGSSGCGNGWTIQYRRTDEQCFYDYGEMDKATEYWEPINMVTVIASYLIGLSWIIASISFVYKLYINNKIKLVHILYYSVTSIIVIGLLATGLHTFEESVLFIVGILLLLSIIYNKKFIEN